MHDVSLRMSSNEGLQLLQFALDSQLAIDGLHALF
jgi:hypothetical protein